MKRMMFFACMLAMGMTALAQNVSPSADWKEIQPKEITINPINLYQDWIVLAVNNEEKPNAMLLTMGTMRVVTLMDCCKRIHTSHWRFSLSSIRKV